MLRYLIGFYIFLFPASGLFADMCWDAYISNAENLAACTDLAKAGDPRAQSTLGEVYYKGRGGVAIDHQKAAEYWQAAAAQKWSGQLDAQLSLGELFSDMDSPQLDFAAAILWLSQAAEAGSLEAQLQLADVYFYKSGAHQDLVKGYMWYLIAQMNGSSFDVKRPARQLTGEQRFDALRLADDWITEHPCTLSSNFDECPVSQ